MALTAESMRECRLTLPDNPYKKLARTPLAQETKICKVNASLAAVIVALLSAFSGPVPCIIIGLQLIKGDYDHKKGFFVMDDEYERKFVDHNFKSHRSHIEPDKVFGRISGVFGIIFSVIHLIGITVALIGASQTNACCIYCWYVTALCHIMLGKVIFLFSLFALGHPAVNYIAALVPVDIALIIFMVIINGKVAGLARNKRYSKMTVPPYIRPGDPRPQGSIQELRPLGLYPRQF